MWSDWIVFFFLIFLPIASAITGKHTKALQPTNKFRFYLKDIVVNSLLLTTLFFFKPSLYYLLDFTKIDRGYLINEEIIFGFIPIFFIPFFLSFTNWSNNYPKDILNAKELFGCPISLLPNSTKEYIMFVCYIVIGVVFEELICRQFMFYSFSTTLSLRGDILVIISSALFAIGHLYQGWKGILSNFILGLFLGKIFLVEGSLVYSIVLHLFLNLTITVLAYRRIKDLIKIKQMKQTL